ncbi:hypothetical protein HUJ05_008359 [Dendroctonus ponderosae]|nr:hypothetical protein HUJ05_008359 [Dendroctonus ponderosae]
MDGSEARISPRKNCKACNREQFPQNPPVKARRTLKLKQKIETSIYLNLVLRTNHMVQVSHDLIHVFGLFFNFSSKLAHTSANFESLRPSKEDQSLLALKRTRIRKRVEEW